MVNPFHSTLFSRRQQAARRYSNFDKSDPHSFNRAVSHINGGIVDFVTVQQHGKATTIHAQYETDTFPGQRAVDERWAGLKKYQAMRGWKVTEEVPVTVHKNISRP